MKIAVTSDLHYNIARSKKSAEQVAEEICASDADVLVVLGDVAGRDVGIVSDCLHLFDRFAGRKLYVAGNHELWTPPGESSLERLERILPARVREAGFCPLDVESVAIDGVGFVGSIGWYDYSFRPGWLEVPRRFYEAKIAPGAAARLPRFSHLVEDLSDVPEGLMRCGARWMDGEHVELGMSDEAFCDYLLQRMSHHLRHEAQRCDRIFVAMHHVPFEELVPRSSDPSWAFAGAYMGSEKFGHLLLSQPKVRYAVCGHSHRAMGVRKGHVTCVNVGCTYVAKRCDYYEI